VLVRQLLKSPVVEAIKGLPQHAQLVLCAALRLQSCATKDATMGASWVSWEVVIHLKKVSASKGEVFMRCSDGESV
jgi:hypothetical protein